MIKDINIGKAISDDGFKVKVTRLHVSYIVDVYALRILIHAFIRDQFIYAVDINQMAD